MFALIQRRGALLREPVRNHARHATVPVRGLPSLVTPYKRNLSRTLFPQPDLLGSRSLRSGSAAAARSQVKSWQTIG